MLRDNSRFNISNLAKIPLSSKERAVLFEIKEKILGKRYELSVVFATSALSRKLNRERRGKDHPANVLAFPLSKQSGEIFLDLKEAKKDAPKFSENTKRFFLRLFIHSLLHLKGFLHSDIMQKKEEKYLSLYLPD